MTPLRELHPSALPVSPVTPRNHEGRAPPSTEEPSAFARLLRGFGREADVGEATVHRLLSPGGHGASDPLSLLALQAGIYRYGETVDLAARLVDKASSSVKTVTQGQ